MEVVLRKESKSFQTKEIKYELSALLDADSFFYGLFDYGSKLAFSNIISSINELDKEDWQERVQLRKSKIGLLNNLVVFIPEVEFKSADIPAILSSVCGIPDVSEYIIRADRSEKFDLRICYAVPKSLIKTMTTTLDGPILHHYLSSFLESIGGLEPTGLYMHYSGEVLIMIALKDGHLAFSNIYKADESLNAFYWLSLAHQSIFEEDKSVPIYYSGRGMRTTSILGTIQSYFPHVNKMTHSISLDETKLSNEVEFYPLHCISEL